MADELLTFENTTAVLQELANDVMAGYKEKLIRDGHFTYYGKDRLVDTISTVVTVDGKSFQASLKMNYYWQFLEEGIQPLGKFKNPGWASFPFILKWVEIKPVIPKPDGKRIPSPKSLAYLITRKRNDVGMEGSHGFEKTREAILPLYYKRIEEALTKDIGVYILKVFNW